MPTDEEREAWKWMEPRCERLGVPVDDLRRCSHWAYPLSDIADLAVLDALLHAIAWARMEANTDA